MFTGKIIKRCLIPAAAVVVETKINSSSPNEKSFCKPSELPIYTPKHEVTNLAKVQIDENTGYIENTVRTVRVTITKYTEELKAYKRVGVEHFDRSKENVDWLVDYLRQEDNTFPKAGAIGIGALTGLIFGLRGGIIKRTLYATTGALGIGAVCYPKEASEYSQIGLIEAKKYLTIAYNFTYGVKKDDPPLELPSLPKIPTSFSEVWDSVKSTATSLISDNQEKLTDAVPKVQEQISQSK